MEKNEKDSDIKSARVWALFIPTGKPSRIEGLLEGGYVLTEANNPPFRMLSTGAKTFTHYKAIDAPKLKPEADFVGVIYGVVSGTTTVVQVGSVVIPNIDTLREGLDRSEIDQVADMAGLTKKEMALLLGRSERNRYYATSKRLSLLESEHLVNLKLLFTQGRILFDDDTKAFSDWLKTPKQALAVPETGFSVELPDDYKKPSIAELFVPHTEQENKVAIEKNMAYNRSRSVEQNKPFPTPLSILDSPTGLRLVSAILGRIEAGVFS